MKPSAVIETISEAKRFLEIAEQGIKRKHPQGDFWWSEGGSVASAAVKRASMNLTRALAKMRKPV